MIKRIFLLTFIVSTIGLVSCSSGNNSGSSADTSTVASPEGLGADTTSSETDSLRDSLNR